MPTDMNWVNVMGGLNNYDLLGGGGGGEEAVVISLIPQEHVLNNIADEVGRNRSAVRKRAKKLGLYLEKMWIETIQGTRQQTLVTNSEGRNQLLSWYGGNDGASYIHSYEGGSGL